MKNILKITFLFAFIFSIQSKAQLDTLSYLKQFEINKAQYIGQPFSKLLQDMTQIQPKTVWSNPPKNNKNIILSLISSLESTTDVVKADIIRKTLEIVLRYTADDV